MKRNVRRFRIAQKIVIPVLSINIVICLFMGIMLNNRMKDSLSGMATRQALEIAKIAEAQLDPEVVKNLRPGDENTKEYKDMVQNLNEIKSKTTIKYVYTLYTDGKEVYFGADASEEKLIGEKYSDSYEVMKEVFSGKEVLDPTIYNTPYGHLINASIPIIDSENNVVGVMGCDFNADSISEQINDNTKDMILITAICIIASFVFSLLIAQGISAGIKKMDIKIKELISNEGDLTKEIRIHTGDELETFAENINQLLGYMRKIMIQIAENCSNLKVSSAKSLTDVNMTTDHVAEVSASMEQMSASVQETTATLNQISQSVSDNYGLILEVNENAAMGNDFTEEIQIKATEIKGKAQKLHEKADREVANRIEKMNVKIEQSKSVNQITDLTSNIIAITQQTNLLSLNASIEAARAGEAGRGFAVVAGEIGKLAANSAEMASQINQVSAEVIQAVEQLAVEAKEIISYLSQMVNEGFSSLVKVSEQYREDATDMNGRMERFLAFSITLRERMDEIRMGIEAVNLTMEDNANEISNVASMAVSVTERVSSILQETEREHIIAEALDKEVHRFKY